MLFAALLRCTSYNGNAIFNGNQRISTVRAGLDGSRRTRWFSQDSTVLAGLDGSRRTRWFSQDSTVLADRTRRFVQDSTVRAGLDGSRRQNSTVRAGSCRFITLWPLRRIIPLHTTKDIYFKIRNMCNSS